MVRQRLGARGLGRQDDIRSHGNGDGDGDGGVFVANETKWRSREDSKDAIACSCLSIKEKIWKIITTPRGQGAVYIEDTASYACDHEDSATLMDVIKRHIQPKTPAPMIRTESGTFSRGIDR